jgi:hypothetical protein
MADLSDDIRSFMQRGITPVTFEEISSGHQVPRPPRRRTLARVASVAVVLAVAVPVIAALSSSGSMAHKHKTADKHSRLARHRVLAALDTTIASGSFTINFSQTPATPATSQTTTTTTCPNFNAGSVSGSLQGSAPVTSTPDGNQMALLCGSVDGGPGLAIAGQGTVDTNPFAMVVQTQVPGLGEIVLRDNGTSVWELGGGEYGLSPGSTTSGPGSSLSGFAGLVEGTLGARQGASDMMVLANPTGYLELDENAITSADQVGSDTVDGVPVTVYQVQLNAAQEATVTGANADQASAIRDALKVLQAQGYTGTSVKIAIDAGGYIRRTVSTAMFSDGSTQTSQTIFSDFGCAGTVLMPGQQGATTPPAGCVSPDTTTTTSPTTTLGA